MRITYGLIAMTATNTLNRAFRGLNNTTNSLLSDAGAARAASNPANSVLGNLVDADIAAISSGVTTANSAISANQTADSALDSIETKLGSMRDLVEDVELEDLTQPQIEAKDAEYQTLADEVVAILEDTTYGDEALLSGRDPLVMLNLDPVTDMSLTDLPEDALYTLDRAVVDVGLAKVDLATDTNDLTNAIDALQDHSEDLTAFASRLTTAQAAMDVLRSITSEFLSQFATILSAQANTSSTNALTLLSVDLTGE